MSTETITVELPSAANLRKFAQANDIPVGTRGTIPASVKEAYAKAPKKVQKAYAGS